MKLLHRQNGFTLIEMVLYVGMMAVIMLGMVEFVFVMMQTRVKNEVMSEVESQGLMVMESIIYTIQNGEGINSPSAGGSGASLSLDVQGAADDPTVYDLSSDTIRVEVASGGAIDMTSSRVVASGLSFTNASTTGSAGSVQITFTLTHANESNRSEYNYAQTFTSTATLKE